MKDDLSLYEFFTMFPDEESARLYFEKKLWGDSKECPHCGSEEVRECKDHKPMPYRCRECRKHFSVRTGTVLEESRLPLHKWLMAIYMLTTARKGISSVQMVKQLGVTQKTAWFLVQRIREAFMNKPGGSDSDKLNGEVEVDETYVGGKEKNKHVTQRRAWGRGATGKLIVVGARSRDGKVISTVVPDSGKETLQGFIHENISVGSKVYTDNWKSYRGLTGYSHEFVNHSVKEYVRKNAHTNGIESFWALLKRGYYGIYHFMSPKHLSRYVGEFSFRHNTSKVGALDCIGRVVSNCVGIRLTYEKLIRCDGR